MNNNNARHIISRLALSVLFLGIGLWEIIQPQYWSTFIPKFLTSIASANALVGIHGVVLLIIGIAVLLGAYLRIAAILASLVMIEVIAAIILESGFSDLLIRDLSVLFLAISLIFDDTDYLRLRK